MGGCWPLALWVGDQYDIDWQARSSEDSWGDDERHRHRSHFLGWVGLSGRTVFSDKITHAFGDILSWGSSKILFGPKYFFRYDQSPNFLRVQKVRTQKL